MKLFNKKCLKWIFLLQEIIFSRENGDKIDNLIHSRSKMVILEVKIVIEIKNLKKSKIWRLRDRREKW